MINAIRHFFCSHQWYWSERHQQERCYHCPKTREGSPGWLRI